MDFLTSKLSRQKTDQLVEKYGTHKKTLEVGSFGSPSYARFFPNRTGVDIKPGRGVDTVASVYQLPFEDNSFEVVLCMTVLEHLEEPARAIAEMRRVLKDGGHMILSVPFLFPIHDAPGDYWRFTKYGLRYLFRDGWEIETLVAESDTRETMAILLQRLGYQTKMRFNKLMKLCVFVLAKMIQKMPNPILRVYGDIGKKTLEPEAFSNGFFLVAKKRV